LGSSSKPHLTATRSCNRKT